MCQADRLHTSITLHANTNINRRRLGLGLGFEEPSINGVEGKEMI